MSNRFGINSATTSGDNNPTVADASETETTQKPFTGLNFNSVVSSSFNDALTNADQVLKTQAAAPKPDNSSFLSVTGNVVTGFGSGLAEQVTTIFKKDKATLAREADQGGISALTSGHSVTASFTRTATDVAHALPALNPFSQDGRKNLGTLGNKWVEGFTTGTADEKAHFLGTNLSFVATLGGGTRLTTKGASAVMNDLRGGTIANRAMGLADNVAGLQDEAATVGRQFGRTVETNTGKVHTFFQQGEKVAASTTESVVKPLVNATDRLGFTGPKASTFGLGTAEVAATQEGNLLKSLQGLYKDARPANFTSTAITDASKVATTKTVDQFDSVVNGLIAKAETPAALQEVKAATEALLANRPGAQSRFTEAIANSGHATELTAHSGQVIRSVERAGSIERLGVTVDKAVQDAGTKLEALTSNLAKGSDEAARIQNIERLINDVARGGNKTDELVTAVNALKKDMPGLNPQLVDGLIADVSKLESAATGRRLLTSFENSVVHVDEAASSFQRALKEAKDVTVPPTGSPQFKAFEDLRAAADDLAHGKINPEQFATKLDELKQAGNISPKALEAVTKEAVNLTERVNVTNLFTHMDDLVKPVKTATSELDNVLAPLAKTSPEQVAKVQQAVADFVAGRSGNTEELTAALRNLANNEKTLATQAGGDIAKVIKVGDDLTAQSSKLVKAVEEARPALTLERSIAESTPILEEAARKWAGNPAQLKAIQEVQTAFNGALKGNVSADELAQVISQNARTLDRAIPGASQSLTVHGTRIADAAVDTSRAFAIKSGVTDIAKASDEMVNAVKGLQTQFAADVAKARPLQSLDEAVKAFKSAPTKTDELTTNLQNAIREARKAEVPFTRQMDEFANTVERTSRLQALEASVVKSRQAANGITATTDLMEAAVRQSEHFQALERLKSAVRTGDADQIAAAVNKSEKGLAELEKIQPGITKQILDDVAKAAEGGNSKALSRLTKTLDEMETVAKRSSSEFKALEEVRAAARSAARDGVGEDLARVIQKNEAQLNSLQQKVAAMETKVAGVESKATNLVKNLTDDARSLGDEAAKVRQINTVENASRSMTNVVDNLAPKLDDAAKQSSFMSKPGGSQLAKDVRELAESATDASTRRNLIAKAEQLEANAGNFNHVRERLNVFKSVSDDVARGTVKESGLTDFARKSSAHLDDAFGKGAGAAVESKAAAIADAQKLVVARESIEAARRLPSFADEATKLGFKADSEVQKLATEYNTAFRNLAHSNGTIDEVNAAAQKLREFKPAVALTEAEVRSLDALVGKNNILEKMQKAAQTMDDTRWAAFESNYKAYVDASKANTVSSYKTALNQLGNMYEVMPPSMQNHLLKLRENTLNQWAAKIIQEQGFYGPNTIAQRAFGGLDGGQSIIARVQNGSFNVRPMAGLETSKSQLLDAAERFNNNIAANQVKFGVRGLTQDRAALLANPNLAQEAMVRQLRKDLLKTAAGFGLVFMGGWTLKEKAQDYLYDQLNAPYKMAELMEREIAATNAVERKDYQDRLAAMVAEYIKDKDQAEIDALREQIKAIIAERTSENPEAQAVWSRRQQALTVGQLRVKKEHENQVQYGNPYGPNIGPGAASAVQESSQQVFVAPPARVRATSINNVDQDGNKRKPATTNFDINKIRDMSNNIAYSQSGLRANPMGTAGQTSLANAYTAGSTKAWQNVVSWNSGRKFATGEPSGKHVYGNFSNLENQPENDQAGIGGGAVAQTSSGNSDPSAASLQMAAAQAQKQQQANQDENATTANV
ncbi:MAG: hypothetical protein C0469_08410 [Cyanobacteria bacterium DS2.3.42]|nr:hypothetical protein [Cyanobacteria bacterium DS2.3.42]